MSEQRGRSSSILLRLGPVFLKSAGCMTDSVPSRSPDLPSKPVSPRSRVLPWLAFGYLLCLVSAAWGFAAGKLGVFPHDLIMEIRAFAKGSALEKNTSLVDKLVNDLQIEPRRLFRNYPESALHDTSDLQIPKRNPRRSAARMWLNPDVEHGFRALFGAMDFEDGLWGGLLIDPDGKVRHRWVLSTDHLPGNRAPDERKLLYGLALLPDGSVIFNQQEFCGGVVRVDADSRPIWVLEGSYHHTVGLDEDAATFWTFSGSQEGEDQIMVNASAETGEILREIHRAEIERANPDLQIFDLQNPPDNVTPHDPLHGNDIEPLPAALAERFPSFRPGDLLVSYRTLNLVFVLDPQSLKIKWWRIGCWDRQHDADWEPDGSVTVFSNNAAGIRAFSDIVRIRPDTMQFERVLRGDSYEFFSKVNGRHQLTPFGTRIITSSSQGWVFEVDAHGQPVFSFVNVYAPEDSQALHMAEAYHVPLEFFTPAFRSRYLQ